MQTNIIINTLKITFNRSIVPALKNPADKNTGTSHLRDIDLAQVPLKSIEEQDPISSNLRERH